MRAANTGVRDIFNRGRNLVVPFYQRAYVWEEEQWERFLDDMVAVSKSEDHYFLGSVILKFESSSTKDGEKRTIIDGQQRLTTIVIFFKVLTLRMGKNNLFNSTFRKDNEEESIILEHNRVDRCAFERIVNLISLEDLEPFNASDRITQAYQYFCQHIQEGNLDCFKRDIILNNLQFVSIDLEPQEDEQRIFDTINSLGMRLTAAELLKNYLFTQANYKDYEQYWRDIFEKQPAKDYWDRVLRVGQSGIRTALEFLLFAYLQIKTHDKSLGLSSVERDSCLSMDRLFVSYKLLLEKKVKGNDGNEVYTIPRAAFLLELREYAKIFFDNINPDIEDSALPPDSGIERVNAIMFALSNVTLLPYVLYILHEQKNLKARNELFGVLETYAMRKLLCGTVSKNSNRFYGGQLIANQIDTVEKFINYASKRQEADSFVGDKELGQHLHTREYKRNSSLPRNLLYMLESKLCTAAHVKKMDKMNKYTLEHIMPRKWEANWGQPQVSEEERNRAICRIGNLALVTQKLNTAMTNSAWVDKRPLLQEYAQGIATMATCLTLQEWNEEDIDKRADELCKLMKNAWPLPNGISASKTQTCTYTLEQDFKSTGSSLLEMRTNYEVITGEGWIGAFRIFAEQLLKLYPERMRELAEIGKYVTDDNEAVGSNSYMLADGIWLRSGQSGKNAERSLQGMRYLAKHCNYPMHTVQLIVIERKDAEDGGEDEQNSLF